MGLVFLAFQLTYALFTLLMWAFWCRIPVFSRNPGYVPSVRISVVVVVRNEEKNLAALFDSLLGQSYPPHLFDVYFVDDFSTDATSSIIREYQSRVPFSLQLLLLKDHVHATLPDGSFKKKGIEWAVSRSEAELIVTTDGDCTAPPHWLATLAAFYEHTHAQMICGGVAFARSEDTIFAKLQAIEFASLIGSGAATLQLGIPTMCNAANLAFTRQAFTQVNGYRDTAATATGDDLFLMHKIHQAYPASVHFLKSPDSIPSTQPQPSLSDFYQQRKRWASKWKLYQDWRVSALAIFVFLGNLTVLAGLGFAIINKLPVSLLLLGILLRWASEWVFLSSILHYLNRGKLIGWIPMVQLVYPVYVVFFGLAVQRKGYRWKGRQLDR